MDDNFFSEFRQAPRSEFAKALRQRLHQQASSEPKPARHGSSWRRSSVLVALSLLVMLAILFSFPSVRAAAQNFLDLFRVKRFAAISIDPARIEQLEQLQDGKIDIKGLLSNSVEVLKEPGKPQIMESIEAAGQLGSIDVRVPTVLPNGLTPVEVWLLGEQTVRFTADTAKLRELLDVLGITDVQVPEQLNGATVTVHVPPAVLASYTKGEASVMFMQSSSPEIALPQGVYLPQLVEIGLRVAGLRSDEAYRFAHSIDWHGTLLVPVPADAASFREVEVRGTTGLLIESSGRARSAGQNRPHFGRGRRGSTLLWSEGDMVYALSGGIRGVELVEMANALQ